MHPTTYRGNLSSSFPLLTCKHIFPPKYLGFHQHCMSSTIMFEHTLIQEKRRRVKRVRGIREWNRPGLQFSTGIVSQLQNTLLGPSVLTKAMMSNEMQTAGPDLAHLKQIPSHTLFDRGMILVSWQESSMIIAFLFIFPHPAVFTINGNSSDT